MIIPSISFFFKAKSVNSCYKETIDCRKSAWYYESSFKVKLGILL